MSKCQNVWMDNCNLTTIDDVTDHGWTPKQRLRQKSVVLFIDRFSTLLPKDKVEIVIKKLM